MVKMNDNEKLIQVQNSKKISSFTKEHLAQLWDCFDKKISDAFNSSPQEGLELHRDKVLYFTMLSYGLRLKEVCNIKITDFFYKASKPEWDHFGGLSIKHAKISRLHRKIYSDNDGAVKMLKWYLDSIRPKLDLNHSEYLFVSTNGSRLNEQYVSQRFIKHLKSAGIPTEETYSIRSLRHTYIHRLISDEKIPISFIMQQIGKTCNSTIILNFYKGLFQKVPI